MRQPLVIVDYDERWPRMFEEERQPILVATCSTLVAVEHIGSTSVPGLAAKDIIDIMAAVERLDDASQCIAPLADLGYHYIPEFEAEFPERRYFHRGAVEVHTHHLHMVERTSEFWRRHLLFRDYLRAHPDAAGEYAELKRRLASRHVETDDYTLAKTDFITSIERKARALEERR